MKRSYDVAVIGLGVIGAATTAMIAATGASVAGIDRFSPPHDRGSSHGETRLLRVAYAEGAAYVPMAQRSVALWRSLEEAFGRKLFHQIGIIYAGDPGSELLSGVRTSAEKHNLSLETPGATASASPAMRVEKGWEVLLEPQAGFLLAEPGLEALLAMARKAGADLVTDRVARFTPQGAGFMMEAGADSFSAGKLVICVGGWLPDMVPEFAGQIWLERRTLHWFEASSAFSLEADFKPFVAALDDKSWIYGFPSLDGASIKVANHFGGGRIVSPSGIHHEITSADTAPVEAAIRRIFPGLGNRIRSKNCLYTMTPDGDFLIGEHPAHANVFIAGGMSGHGFKFAPAIGELAAQWVNGKTLPPEAAMFNPARVFRG